MGKRMCPDVITSFDIMHPGRGVPLATLEQPLSPFTDDPTDGGRWNMRDRERQPLRLCSVEPRGPCAAAFFWIHVAWRAEAGVVQLEREVQEVTGEEHPLVAGIQEDASVSWGVTRRVSQTQAGQQLAVLDGRVELPR